MTDQDASLHAEITRLVEREHALRDDMTSADADGRAEDRDELRRIEEALDVCWDLLRQRQARRDAGQSESETAPRSASTVENYRQ